MPGALVCRAAQIKPSPGRWRFAFSAYRIPAGGCSVAGAGLFWEGPSSVHSTDRGCQPADPAGAQARGGILLKVVTATLARLLLNTSRRFVYPFANVFSRQLALPLTAITSLIAVNQMTAVLGIAAGPLIDRAGYRRVMLAGMGLLCLGMGWAGISGSYWGLMAALTMAGLAKTIYDPAVQAYLGRQVAFANRGAAIGSLEFAWSGSTLVGIPLAALAMDSWGWRAPFFIIAGLSLAGLVALGAVFEKDAARHPGATGGDFIAGLSAVKQKKAVLGAMVWAFMVSLANDNLFVVYGAWLETSFDMGIVALGLSTGLIGLAEMLAESFTVFAGDRFGLKRSVVAGSMVTVAAYFVLPFNGAGPRGALAGLFLLFLAFEFTMVCGICLATELLPGSRATMMAAFYAAAGLGRVAGAAGGGLVWQQGGIRAVGIVSGAVTAIGTMILWYGLAGWSHDGEGGD